jgi:uncharacterized pyridoxamine 5'-phosphate oxidase family protein
MSQAYDFLKECGTFFVLTINGDYPAGRPFGAVMEVGEDLYLSTSDLNEAHKQLRKHNKIQIIAKKPDSISWIRINGIAEECNDFSLKQKMYQEYPVVKQIFTKVGEEHLILIKVIVKKVEIK